MRKLMGAVAGLMVLVAQGGAGAQDNWPSRPIRLIVPFAPGGNTDAVARVTAEYMQSALKGASVIVENRGGAGGIVGTEAVAKAAPDGYTLCVCSIGSITISPALERLPYDPLKDLIPISLLGTNALVLIAHPSLEAKSVQDVIKLAKAKPKSLDYGSSGVGGLMHVSALLFQAKTGTDLVHVPYRGGAPATQGLVAGDVKLVFANMSDAIGQIEGGTVRALGVTTATRTPAAPQIPTIAESGVPGFHAESWNALFAPAGTPQPIIDRLARIAADMAKDPAVQKRMAEFGSVAAANTPQDFAKMLREETAQWADLLKQSGLAKAQ
jgi:tripartite-type tricarboxylate transporter receptor subunit TctC